MLLDQSTTCIRFFFLTCTFLNVRTATYLIKSNSVLKQGLFKSLTILYFGEFDCGKKEMENISLILTANKHYPKYTFILTIKSINIDQNIK